MNEQTTNTAREHLENAVHNSLAGIELDLCAIDRQPNSGPYNTFFEFALPLALVHENLEQIKDNGEAVEAITTMLNFIRLIQAKPPCDNCQEWHNIVAEGTVVAGLYQGIRAISRYSNLLSQETKRGLPEREEADPE